MRFRAEHRFGAATDEVIDVLLDPAFHRELQLPDLATPEVLFQGEDHLRLRYEYVGHLDPIAHRLLRGRRLAWLQALRIDRAGRRGRLTFAAEADPRRLKGVADMTFDDTDNGSVRHVAGELVVDAPLVGNMAERRILPGLLRRLDIEAHALEERLGRA
jgi:hypothetical protein